MAEATCPIVLVEIDRNSRIRILQHEGVRVAFVDRRADPVMVILPEVHQPIEIDEAVGGLQILSLRSDDQAKTAVETIRRISAREIVVAAGPEVEPAR